MKIKLHNSLGRVDRKYGNAFLFNEKIFIGLPIDTLGLRYQVDDCFYFIAFSLSTKEFTERSGFGGKKKMSNPNWWKDPKWQWEEMSK